jgi:deoxyribodipyrimidine photo-lyase
MTFENGLFIFRRDFRIVDNNGLYLTNTNCKRVYTVFIFTPEQVGNANPFKSNNAVQFMIESLQDLQGEIKSNGGELLVFYGDNETVIKKLIHALDIDFVCFNADYTPYALERDAKIAHLCEKEGVVLSRVADYYLHEPGTIFNGSGGPYQKFTPYYNAALKKKVQPASNARSIKFVKPSTGKNLSNKIGLDAALKKFTKINPDILVHGGRKEALKSLQLVVKTQKHYSTTRNDLFKPTTQLSAPIKFGCISVREAYEAFKKIHDLIRQLIWRDFYMNILFSFPHVLGSAMKPNYNKIKWHHNAKWLKAWEMGATGYPVVDACMRQLNTTGYMHNRGRLIVASFLIKTLLISWEEGEKIFAKKLTDYDPASNNGNWQWVSGSGADSQPYFRIFNPWEQGIHFDPNAEYIKHWVPELKDVPAKVIHTWYNEHGTAEYKNIKYPGPIVDYSKQKEETLAMYAAAFK